MSAAPREPLAVYVSDIEDASFERVRARSGEGRLPCMDDESLSRVVGRRVMGRVSKSYIRPEDIAEFSY